MFECFLKLLYVLIIISHKYLSTYKMKHDIVLKEFGERFLSKYKILKIISIDEEIKLKQP